MANTINIYETRTMLRAVNMMKPTYNFLRDTFFPSVQTLLTEVADVDIKKGKRKMAPFVAPRIGGVVMDRDGFETKTIKTPKIAPQRILTKDDINTRGLGEAIYSQRKPEERARELLAADLVDLNNYIDRREEWMCREVLLNGKVTMSGKGFDQEVNYNFTNKETLAGGAIWTAKDTSKPIDDLKNKRLTIIQKAGIAPDVILFASDVVNDFIEHPQVQNRLDLLRFNAGTIEPSIKSNAITFYGKLPELGAEMYSYDEWYLDDNDVEQPMIPAGHVLIGSKGMGQRYYGAVTQMENGEYVTYEGIRVPKSWVDEENETKMVKITARPLPAPFDVDSWYILKVK